MVPLIICKAVQVNFWVLWGQEGCLGDPIVLYGCFDESSDDSQGIYACIHCILYKGSRFSLRVDGASEVVQEVLANSVITDGNVPLIVYLHI